MKFSHQMRQSEDQRVGGLSFSFSRLEKMERRISGGNQVVLNSDGLWTASLKPPLRS